MSLEDRAKLLAELQKLGIGVVSILVIGGILAFYLHQQIGVAREAAASIDKDRDRMHQMLVEMRAVDQRQVDRILFLTEQTVGNSRAALQALENIEKHWMLYMRTMEGKP